MKCKMSWDPFCDRINRMLTLYRRHTPKCPHRAKGRQWLNCKCPIWVDGTVKKQRYCKSLGTRDLRRAGRKLAELEEQGPELRKAIHPAIEAFLEQQNTLARGTARNHRRAMNFFGELAERYKLIHLEDVTVEFIDAFRVSRELSPLTWTKELQILRHFFSFCLDRGWISQNPAKRVKVPTIKPSAKEPYTLEERTAILAACDQIGSGRYERLRARAMVLLLRYTGLRISDVATLARDRVRAGEIYLHTMKNGVPIKLPVHPELQIALDRLPQPRGMAEGEEPRYFFWTGNGSREAMIRDATRTLYAVFSRSGVVGAHAHRFRHTLATEILTSGGSVEDAANILGNSPMIIRKHYAQWTTARQERISTLMQSVFGTKMLRREIEPVKL